MGDSYFFFPQKNSIPPPPTQKSYVPLCLKKFLSCYKFSQRILGAESKMPSRGERSQVHYEVVEKTKTELRHIRIQIQCHHSGNPGRILVRFP